jgi:hypothetical protein
MNPYTSSVVNEIGRLGKKQFNELLAPGATAGAVGSGQFGSTRGMQVYGNVARDVAQNILGQQTGALEAGYKSALSAAQQDALLRNQAAQVLGALSGQAQAQDIAGINALQQQGALAQAQRQAELNYPMGALSNIAGLIRGFQIPTTQTQTFRGPGQQGNYQLSPLAQVAGVLGTTGQGLTNLNQLLGGTTGQNAFSNIFNAIKGGLGLNSTSAPTNISAPTGLTKVTNAADGSSIFWDPYSQSYVDSSGNFADVSFEG